MIEVMQNDGSGKGCVVSGPARICTPARAHLTGSDPLTSHVAVFAVWNRIPRHITRHQDLSANNFHIEQWVVNNCHRLAQPLWSAFNVYAPCQKRPLRPPTPHHV